LSCSALQYDSGFQPLLTKFSIMLQIWATVAEKTFPTVVANYVIWPAAHIISFRYVPSQQRILYNNSIAIFWNCYLSLVAAGNSNVPSSGPGGSWEEYAFWTGLPGGLVADPGVSNILSDMYQNAQDALGMHPDTSASMFAPDFSKIYHDLQSGLYSPETVSGLTRLSAKVSQLYHEAQTAVVVHTPEPVLDLADQVVQGVKMGTGASAPAPHSEGMVQQLKHVADSVAKGVDTVQGCLHDTILHSSVWLKGMLQVCNCLDHFFHLQ
jgi:hypothetical protein